MPAAIKTAHEKFSFRREGKERKAGPSIFTEGNEGNKEFSPRLVAPK
jgi:hypothetical protein